MATSISPAICEPVSGKLTYPGGLSEAAQISIRSGDETGQTRFAVSEGIDARSRPGLLAVVFRGPQLRTGGPGIPGAHPGLCEQ
jgi:hypothetical protein